MAWWYPSRALLWHIWPCLFLCSSCSYTSLQRLWCRHGCLAVNVFWQPHLIDILDIVFPIWNLGCECWFDYGNSLKVFLPFFLAIISFLFLYLHLCCVNKINFCMSACIMLVLSSSPKLQEYLQNKYNGFEWPTNGRNINKCRNWLYVKTS
jgi:hypothetical protein